MRWIVIFTNKPDSETLRAQYLNAHLRYFEAQSKITMAGSTLVPGEEASNGGVWIIKGADYDEARRICEEDPFFKAGLRKDISIFEYRVAPIFESKV